MIVKGVRLRDVRMEVDVLHRRRELGSAQVGANLALLELDDVADGALGDVPGRRPDGDGDGAVALIGEREDTLRLVDAALGRHGFRLLCSHHKPHDAHPRVLVERRHCVNGHERHVASKHGWRRLVARPRLPPRRERRRRLREPARLQRAPIEVGLELRLPHEGLHARARDGQRRPLFKGRQRAFGRSKARNLHGRIARVGHDQVDEAPRLAATARVRHRRLGRHHHREDIDVRVYGGLGDGRDRREVVRLAQRRDVGGLARPVIVKGVRLRDVWMEVDVLHRRRELVRAVEHRDLRLECDDVADGATDVLHACRPDIGFHRAVARVGDGKHTHRLLDGLLGALLRQDGFDILRCHHHAQHVHF